MDIQLAFYPQALLLVIARIAAVVGGTVVFGKAVAPMQVRILISFAVALVITPMVPEEWARIAMAMDNLPKMVFGMFGEILFGVAIALVCELFAGVFMMTGHIAGWGSSLTMSRTVDPISGVQSNVLGLLLQLIFLMLIWAHGGHLILLEILYKSFYTVPPTFAWLDHGVTEMMVTLGGLMFEWGVKLAAPILAGAMIISAAMGLVAKLAPQFNILFLSLPIRLGTGMMMMGFFFRYGSGHMRDVIRTMLEYCSALTA